MWLGGRHLLYYALANPSGTTVHLHCYMYAGALLIELLICIEFHVCWWSPILLASPYSPSLSIPLLWLLSLGFSIMHVALSWLCHCVHIAASLLCHHCLHIAITDHAAGASVLLDLTSLLDPFVPESILLVSALDMHTKERGKRGVEYCRQTAGYTPTTTARQYVSGLTQINAVATRDICSICRKLGHPRVKCHMKDSLSYCRWLYSGGCPLHETTVVELAICFPCVFLCVAFQVVEIIE